MTSLPKDAHKLAWSQVKPFIIKFYLKKYFKNAIHSTFYRHCDDNKLDQLTDSKPILRYCSSFTTPFQKGLDINYLTLAIAYELTEFKNIKDFLISRDMARTFHENFFTSVFRNRLTKEYFSNIEQNIIATSEASNLDPCLLNALTNRVQIQKLYFKTFESNGTQSIKVLLKNDQGLIDYSDINASNNHVLINNVNLDCVDMGFYLLGHDYLLAKNNAYLHTVFTNKNYTREYANFGAYCEHPLHKNLIWVR